jgi:hypothetical protein
MNQEILEVQGFMGSLRITGSWVRGSLRIIGVHRFMFMNHKGSQDKRVRED